MDNILLKKLYKYLENGLPPIDFKRSLELIYNERLVIENEILHTGKQVYGFTTLFGPNDGVPIHSNDQQKLLNSHCIGHAKKIDKKIANAILGVKLIQLSQGGSGISPSTYSYIFELLTKECEIYSDLELSYGSGDVVPASWVISSIFPKYYVWNPGDIISLINGNYISTAFLYKILNDFIDLYSEFIHTISKYVLSPSDAYKSKYFKGIFDKYFKERDFWNPPPQLPVSIRDSQPILKSGEDVIVKLAETISDLLGNPSANPLFVINDNKIKYHSQSSFLNFNSRICLDMVGTVLSIMSSYIQRITESLAMDIRKYFNESDYQSLKAVQVPKVSEAIKINIQNKNIPINFSGSMSGGVEDIWDTSLISSQVILDVIPLVRKQIYILRDMLGSDKEESNNDIITNDIWNYIL